MSSKSSKDANKNRESELNREEREKKRLKTGLEPESAQASAPQSEQTQELASVPEWVKELRSAYKTKSESSMLVPNVPILTVQNEYLDYIDWQRKKDKPNYVAQGEAPEFPEHPFGEYMDYKPNDALAEWYDEKELRPIQGPPNWNQLWPTFESIGKEYKEVIPKGKPMIQKHLNYLQSLDTEVDQLLEQPLDQPSPDGKIYRKPEKEISILNRINFESKLGEGSYGTVWRVRAKQFDCNTKTQTNVSLACKVIRLDPKMFLGNPNMFGEELKDNMESKRQYNILGDMLSLRHLNHKNICNLVDVIQIPDSETGFPFATYCLFMELCDGDLGQLVENSIDNRLTEEQTKHWFRHIVAALVYMHGMNVIHQDIKLENILFKKLYSGSYPVLDSHFKLGDFGLAVCYREPLKTVPLPPDELNKITNAKLIDINLLVEVLIEALGLDSYHLSARYHLGDQEIGHNFQISVDLVRLLKEFSFERTLTTAQQLSTHKWLQN